MKGNKDNNAQGKKAINHDTVTQHMGTIHLTSTSKYLLTSVPGHSFTWQCHSKQTYHLIKLTLPHYRGICIQVLLI